MASFVVRILIASSLLSFFLTQANEQQSSSQNELLASIEQRILSGGYQPVSLDFASWYAEAKSQDYLSVEEIAQFRLQIGQVNSKNLCDKLRSNNILFQLNLLDNRSRLVTNTNKTKDYEGIISDLDNGKEWYLHWLNTWLALENEGLLNDAHIDMLKSIARSELEALASDYRLNIESLEKTNKKSFTEDQTHIIEEKLRQKEQRVKQALVQLLPNSKSIPALTIAKSNLPNSFPAPGIYDGRSKTFYYHFTDNQLPAESLDWLYLHEGVPGHHYQASYVQQYARCPISAFNQATYITEEGWGAYVETLGKDLGLYQDLASETYAQEWRILRALRVLIDIGIHYENWSDQQAMDVWSDYLPNRKTIGEREIARIKRWPVQVITYVYGKAQIEGIIKSARSNYSDIELKEIHQNILSLSNYPVSQFKDVIKFNVNSKDSANAL